MTDSRLQVGPGTVSGTTYSRSYTNAEVTLDCATLSSTIAFKSGPQPPPPPAPPPPPPAPHQCAIHIHHSQGCYNYSDWKVGTPGPVLPLYEAAVGAELTLEACGAACYKSNPNNDVGGVVGGDQCFCGTPADLSTAAAKARSIASRPQCETKPCVGDPTGEKGCGGVGTMLAYAFSCDRSRIVSRRRRGK